MHQSAILKKKGSNLNKAQSPSKNLDFDMQYRSSAELANKFKIKREQLSNECNDRAKKDQAPIHHKRKNSEDFIPQQGKSKLLGHKSVIQSSSREEISTSHMIAGKGQTNRGYFNLESPFKRKELNFLRITLGSKRLPRKVSTLGNGEVQHDIEDLLNFKQVKRKSVRPATSIDQFLDNQRIHNEHNIHDLPNCKKVKRKSVIPANSLDQFQKNQGICIDDETKRDNHTIADVEFMHAPIINEHNKGLDDLVDQEELGGDECDVEEEIGIDYSTKEISKPKKVRGQTTCKDIHARNLEERKEVTFDKGQAVGPTNKIVSELSNFIGTIARNPRFISLMYTSWYAVPNDTKKRMWEYINRAAKENNEEPSKTEMFIATRSKTGKEIQVDTQVAIFTMDANFIQQAELQNRQNSGETADDAFMVVFGKEQPGRLRCYGRSVTTSSLKKDEEINNLKQKHANEITSLKDELREEMRHLFTQLLQNNPRLNFQDIHCVGSNLASPVDANSAQAVRGTNLSHSSSSFPEFVDGELNLPWSLGMGC
ncbi:hypothetical protein MTR67_030902 [Solanum verrucosum]|uniref:Uncharacterized protein n=1 Tax=Solanum verrucosum TaxID=315347 RepID=A0AAF0ZE36_SOLVR|nr:hypothetical protein MTR67_030902 [Solanum verrucosum]